MKVILYMVNDLGEIQMIVIRVFARSNSEPSFCNYKALKNARIFETGL